MYPTFPTAGRSARTDLRTDVRLVATDCLLVGLAFATALLLRFDGAPAAEQWARLVPVALVAVCGYVTLLATTGSYGRVWRQAGAAEAWALAVSCAVVTTMLTALVLAAGGRSVPASVVVTAGALTLIGLSAARFHDRLRARLRARPVLDPEDSTAVLLIGHLEQARAVIAQMREQPECGMRPVAVLNDEPLTWSRHLAGIPVTGPLDAVLEHAEQTGATQVLLLPGELPAATVRRLAERTRDAGLRLCSLPSLHESMDRGTRLRDIRDLSLEDLLGRDQVDVDDDAVRAIIEGRRVLVTGAGGSIGGEIAAQVSRLRPASLILLDHDETHLHDAVVKVSGPATCVLGDIRDEAFVERLMQQVRPELVFHAAAHKHVPILEEHPVEAVRTNVHGTDVLVRAALRAGTTSFVAISTDKAVCPRSVMGASKRLAEQLVTRQDSAGTHYCAVRFGNVLGSRGSVVPTFVRQVEAGGPVTVTHPAMTRFFMTTREAVTLVLQAAATAEGSEIFMLDMGEPVRILDLAERVIEMAGLVPGHDIDIRFTGLRPGEKLNEQLSGLGETVHPTGHPKIFRVDSPLIAERVLRSGVQELVRRAWNGVEEPTRQLLFELAELPDVVRLDGDLADLDRVGLTVDDLTGGLDVTLDVDTVMRSV